MNRRGFLAGVFAMISGCVLPRSIAAEERAVPSWEENPGHLLTHCAERSKRHGRPVYKYSGGSWGVAWCGSNYIVIRDGKYFLLPSEWQPPRSQE